MKIKVTEQEKIFINHISPKGPDLYEDLLQVNNETNNQIGK